MDCISADYFLPFVLICSCLFSGRVQEGMRELDVLKDKRDVNLASTMTLMLGHKYSQTVGMDVCYI